MGWASYRSRSAQIMKRVTQANEACETGDFEKAADCFRRAAHMTRNNRERSILAFQSVNCREQSRKSSQRPRELETLGL